MQRKIVKPQDRHIRLERGRMVDGATRQYIQWCPVCKQWFLTWNTLTITCGDKCRKALSRARQAQGV